MCKRADASGLVVITQIDPMTVIFTVTEDDISKVTARLAAVRGSACYGLRSNE